MQADAKLDWGILGLVLTLMMVGLVMQASASASISLLRFDTPWHYFLRQLMYVILALVLMYGIFQASVASWLYYRGFWLITAIVLLVLVLIVGREINGATRWIHLGFINFQPAEWAKLASTVFLAGYMQRHLQDVRTSFWALFRLAIPYGIITFLLLLEPDFGSFAVILAITVGLLIIGGAPLRYFAMIVIPMMGILFLLVTNADYRMSRVTSFLDPWADPFGSSYQLVQALIAVGEGGLTGVGLGNSVQKLLYLPDAHTDFLFAIFSEEWGFMGVAVLVFLYLALFIRLVGLGRSEHQQGRLFTSLIVFGVALWTLIQAAINMGANLGLLPTKGLTLPFISYGGSSLLIFAMAYGLVLRIHWESQLQNADANPSVQENP